MIGVGIVDDAACVREQPRESKSTTVDTVFDKVIVGHYHSIFDLNCNRSAALNLQELLPELPLGSRGKLEVTVTFTPSTGDTLATQPCWECKLRSTCKADCQDLVEWRRGR